MKVTNYSVDGILLLLLVRVVSSLLLVDHCFTMTTDPMFGIMRDIHPVEVTTDSGGWDLRPKPRESFKSQTVTMNTKTQAVNLGERRIQNITGGGVFVIFSDLHDSFDSLELFNLDFITSSHSGI